MAAIIAAYARNGQKPPITPAYIMYDAQPDEVRQIISTVIELRNQWYGIPSTIEATEFRAESEQETQVKKRPTAYETYQRFVGEIGIQGANISTNWNTGNWY